MSSFRTHRPLGLPSHWDLRRGDRSAQRSFPPIVWNSKCADLLLDHEKFEATHPARSAEGGPSFSCYLVAICVICGSRGRGLGETVKDAKRPGVVKLQQEVRHKSEDIDDEVLFDVV